MELTALRNIGGQISRKLQAVGIDSAEELREVGAKDAFLRMRMLFPEVCLVHLYTLQGAIDDVDYNALSVEMKQELKRFSDGLKP